MSESTKKMSTGGYTSEIAQQFEISETEYARIIEQANGNESKAYGIWENDDSWVDAIEQYRVDETGSVFEYSAEHLAYMFCGKLNGRTLEQFKSDKKESDMWENIN